MWYGIRFSKTKKRVKKVGMRKDMKHVLEKIHAEKYNNSSKYEVYSITNEEYNERKKYIRYGIFNTSVGKFQFPKINAESYTKAQKQLFYLIGKDAYKYRFRIVILPQKILKERGIN